MNRRKIRMTETGSVTDGQGHRDGDSDVRTGTRTGTETGTMMDKDWDRYRYRDR